MVIKNDVLKEKWKEGIWCFKLLSYNFHGGTTIKHENPLSVLTVSRLRFEGRTSWIANNSEINLDEADSGLCGMASFQISVVEFLFVLR